jgi:hypothetical protein
MNAECCCECKTEHLFQKGGIELSNGFEVGFCRDFRQFENK